MSNKDGMEREILPIPAPGYVGATLYDAKDPENRYPPIVPLRPPPGAPGPPAG